MGEATDKLSGKGKQAIGKVTGNKEVQLKGKAQEAKGNAKDSLKHAGKKASNKIDELTKKIN